MEASPKEGAHPGRGLWTLVEGSVDEDLQMQSESQGIEGRGGAPRRAEWGWGDVGPRGSDLGWELRTGHESVA